jgi:hypothetical protein
MNIEAWLKSVAGYWPLAVLFLIVLTGTLYGFAPSLLVLAACLLVLALVLFWHSLGELANEEPLTLDEALELAAPERREQEKMSLLRGLKDLEQEHRFGKISDTEFAAESARLRQQAKRLLSSFDESIKSRRQKVEHRLKQVLKTSKAAEPKQEPVVNTDASETEQLP